MDLFDISTYMILEPTLRRERDEFVKLHGLKNFDDVRYLMYINFFLEKKNICYDFDLAQVHKHDNNTLNMMSARKRCYGMKFRGLINYDRSKKLHPVYKRCYIITDKGYGIIDNYLSFVYKKEKELIYKIKNAKKEITEEE